MHPGLLVDSILEAVFMVSPKMENLGSLVPTSPETQGPVWIPIRMQTVSPLWGIRTWGWGNRLSRLHHQESGGSLETLAAMVKDEV